MIQYKTNQR